MGWEALGQWGEDVARIEPLAGGVANDVWSVRVNGHLAVGRLGARSDTDLAWETELLQHLDREGPTVPVPIPTTSPTSPWCCPTTPSVSTTARMTSPRKRLPRGKPPSAGAMSTQSSGLPEFERSGQRQQTERR